MELLQPIEGKAGFKHADLGWTSSVLPRGPENEFVFVEAAFGDLASVKVGTPLKPSIEHLARADGKGTYTVRNPAFGAATEDGGFVVRIDREGPDQLIFVNRGLQLERTLDLPVDMGDGETLRAIARFTSLRDGGLLAVGFVETRDSYDGYLVHVSADLQQVSRIGMPLDDRVERLYIRDFSPVASIGNTGFALVMEETPWIARVDPGSKSIEPLPGFPERFQVIPPEVLTAEMDESVPAGIERMFRLYQFVEHAQMPVGIYAWNGRLFILAKEAVVEEVGESDQELAGEGHTRWLLIEVSPKTGDQIAEFRLPTSARYLTLSPGETFAMLEKGRIEKVTSWDGYRLFRYAYALKLFAAELLTTDDSTDLQCAEIALRNK
jgi:hypothetical protein